MTAACPFSAETGHRVRLGMRAAAVHALCAIGALGVGAMLARDTAVESSCPACGAPVQVATREEGRALHSVTPAAAAVWSAIRYADGCCATSGCGVKAFVCSDGNLAV